MVLHYNNTLHLLLAKVQKECPSLVWFYPKNDMFWLGASAQDLLSDTMMMVFVCPVTFKVIKCGPQGTGWEIRAPREFLTKIMPALLISLFVMQAAVLEGNEVLIPLSWQNSPVSVATALIPNKVVNTALKDKFDADHFMRCLSVFADAMKTISDLSDRFMKQLSVKIRLQQDRYKQITSRATSPQVTLGADFTSDMFKESYKNVHILLTTGGNATLGKLEDQLRGSMERVMAEDGDLEWVSIGASQKWLQMHARCVDARLPSVDYTFETNYGRGNFEEDWKSLFPVPLQVVKEDTNSSPPTSPATNDSDIQRKLRGAVYSYCYTALSSK